VKVRRFWAMLLLGIFSFTLIGPALASASTGSDLPACCRRDGKHHCGMAGSKPSSGAEWQSARCPSFPSVKGLPSAHDLAAAPPPIDRIIAPAPAHRAVRPQSAAARRASFELGRQKRGPPASS
jgi:hypothetical protein